MPYRVYFLRCFLIVLLTAWGTTATLAQAPSANPTADSLRRATAQLRQRFDASQQRARIRELEQAQRIARLQAERQEARSWLWAFTAASMGLGLLSVGAILWLLVRSRDRLRISEQEARAAELTARAANQMKDELMSIIGHDLRGPVAAFQQVGGMLRFYVRRPDPAGLGELADELERSAGYLSSLLDNLLHWAHAQSDQVIHHPTDVTLGPLVEEVVGLHHPSARLKGVALVADVSPDLRVWADPDLVRTVLRNLVANAVKFTPADGQVRVRAWRQTEASTVTLEVSDTGVGIEPTRAATLFDASRTVSTPGTRGEAGTGLGLPLSARFVRLLAGELTLKSQPGHGSCFTFALPVGPVANNR